ncbi:SDR family NAD(P)-dependent oxidoreductase [Micromonospora sp. 15K316]|uniref:SDR family NAD(P)-dependent oxidoreductase n=1 Tax=Micromonospora sp. 15K316 TaxID=2530376 RepID=UPI0010491388|nr:SDR family NAD(P)-dependent oxidoreductase [Micromonospora sp. 15K316]TDC25437.1 SDR family NAD(P)-dependent oxidoreductase [Micromonospora sp. 15K316]
MSRVVTPFTAQSTAADVIAGVDLSGRRAIVTGGASGIGLETARALASAGAEVTLAVRDPAAGERAAADIRADHPSADVRVARLDLADLAGVEAFTAAGWTGPLHILVNNAGIMALPQLTTTAAGWEAQFAVNHLGHAALTLGLHDALAAAGHARVVTVSSSAHLMSPVVFDDIHFSARPYEAWSAYGQSKTASILFTVALAEKWAADGITANALHPGGIMTNLQRHLDEGQLRFVGALDERGNRLEVPPGWKTPQQGAATTVLLAASPAVAGLTGRYFEDCAEATVVVGQNDGRSGVAGYALDTAAAERLWDETLRLLAR